MIVLGVDPGLQKTGYGVIQQQGHHLRLLGYGLIKPPVKNELSDRLGFLHKEFVKILDLYKPHSVAIEETFVNKNPVSTLKLGHARGVLMMTPSLYNMPVFEYGANKIKKSIVGAGHADKDQMMAMIQRLLPEVNSDLTSDSADALAVAICHAHHQLFSKNFMAM